MKIDLNKSLQEIEGVDWREPNFDSSLVTECHRLWRMPLCEFKPGDLRRMIGQNIGLEFLIPMAIELLAVDPLSEVTFYPADLLVSVLRADRHFWSTNPEIRMKVSDLMQHALLKLNTLDTTDRKTAEDALSEASQVFDQSA